MKSKTAVVLLLLTLAAGCATAPAESEPQTALESPAQYDMLWRAAVEVVGRRFSIAAAEKESGTIETDYLVTALSKTSLKSNAVTRQAAAEEFLHTTRRRATLKLNPDEPEAVEVAVTIERMVRVRPDAVRGGTFSLGVKLGGGDESSRYGSRWIARGRDEALEKRIVEEIAARLEKLSHQAR